ncbi:MAG: hypothetical protein MUE69_33285 [Myxococcota bacterium]|jgi:hypothetical protein|nr:hypothetical protein [Myxococcota bacterium]
MTQWKAGVALATREDFERALLERDELLGPNVTSDERRVWEAALTVVAQELAATPRPLALDGTTWRSSCRAARVSRCGRCEVCLWEQQTDRLARPPRHEERRSATVDEWLESWIGYVEDPHGAKSPLGIQLDRLSSGLSHGGSFVAREPAAVRAATLFVGVEAALRAAAVGACGENQALRADEVLAGMRALIVGVPKRSKKRGVTRELTAIEEVAARWSAASEREGGDSISPRAAKELLRRWRRRAAIELAARGLVRAPRGHEDDVEQARARLTTEKARKG